MGEVVEVARGGSSASVASTGGVESSVDGFVNAVLTGLITANSAAIPKESRVSVVERIQELANLGAAYDPAVMGADAKTPRKRNGVFYDPETGATIPDPDLLSRARRFLAEESGEFQPLF